jgi:hypothetical protein
MSFAERYNEMYQEIETKLTEMLNSSLFCKTGYWDDSYINIDKILNKKVGYNYTDYDGIRFNCSHTPIFTNGQFYSLCAMDFETLCKLVDDLYDYYLSTSSEFEIKDSYTEEEIDEMTFEEMEQLELSEETLETLSAMFDDDENFSDDEYIEEYRKEIKKKYIKK